MWPKDDRSAFYSAYMYDPTYIERRFGATPLSAIIASPDVRGAARLAILPSFSGESIVTFVYRPEVLSIEILTAEESLWCSQPNHWQGPTLRSSTYGIGDVPPMLRTWDSLRDAAMRAPTVTFAIIDGQQLGTLDGIGYRHHVVGRGISQRAKWVNPTKHASNHVAQVELLEAYRRILGDLIYV